MTKVEKDKVVEIHYTLRLSDGTVEDSTEGEPPLPYLHGAGNIPPGLERALEGHNAGDTFTVTLQPTDAYGEYDDEMVDAIPRDAFPDETELAEGDEIWLIDEEGNETPGIIERIEEEMLFVDYNHPLAGETVTFDVQVVEVRDATPEELEHGHAHDQYADEWDEDEDDEDWEDDDEELDEEEDDEVK
ncbi:MAG: peptidylprolyl isomerase [Ardenticatenales bacterium]|nr:peptidylprolyl isomerase [Ardenticatenales bacterium]